MIIEVWSQGNKVSLDDFSSLVKGNEYYGPHLMLDLEHCNPEQLRDKEVTFAILRKVPPSIGMTLVSGPHVIQFDGNGDPAEQGISGFCIIAESHISVHTYPEKDYAFVDVFSCKPFDAMIAVRNLIAAYQAQKAVIYFQPRGLAFPR